MSKIGKKPVVLKTGVTAEVKNGSVFIKGAKGELSYLIPDAVTVAVVDNTILVTQKEGLADARRAMFGLTRALLANMVKGVSDGFVKKLELTGVGYRAQMQGNDLSISVGFSHPVKIVAPLGIQFAVLESTIVVTGMDKTRVGDLAATIRAVRKPEPYKGKGIKYEGEKIRRKAGKAAKAVGTK